ncbi:PREDICTED: 28S ribosomal protein S35, mitochondrial-like [Amphimedon queenslandica]|uniref:Small ribosomal subunit protein mS35 mitochondrial conserved domain-containing protein n=1 Tax=Amphimedon queenslandica TaxID=400682 RepID=A0A1X7VNJ0_AMPQE|nr:PREDICTED: 28S ribosomal protein S35, mitochondrial-like [Amphimedon queenslandica]|eukprot:XP_003383405.1 PREDICTED: 28S ribosomal protein S35, mitochondrial-like [Amphimedon queenslandica]
MAALRPPLLKDTLCFKWINWSRRSYATGASTNRGPVRGFRKGTRTHNKKDDKKPRFFEPLISYNKMKPHKFNEGVEWSSVCQTARPFDPYLIPLSLRMGRPPKGEVPPPVEGNHELLKIPNFFHLTPPAIEKHCVALKELCTDWPRELPRLPITVSSINKLSASSDIRDESSRIVKLRFKVSDLKLPERARTKLIKLADHRYNKKNDIVTIIGDRCPIRKQNREYVEYIMKVLMIESMKEEEWEKKNEEP